MLCSRAGEPRPSTPADPSLGNVGRSGKGVGPRSRQCQAPGGFQGRLEHAFDVGAKIADAGATLAAITGQEEVAVPLEGLALGLQGVRALSQGLRGDSAGALTTIETTASSYLIGKAGRILPIGGPAQAKFNGRLATALGYGNGQALNAICE